MRATRAIVCAAFIMEIVGVWFSARGVVRESFVELAQEPGGLFPLGHFPPGHYPPGVYGDARSAIDEFLVSAGLTMGLLPSERELTADHRRENARSAVFGVVLVLVGMLVNGVVKARETLHRILVSLSAKAAQAARCARSMALRLRSFAHRR